MSSSSEPVFGPALRGCPLEKAVETCEQLFTDMCELVSPVIGEMTLKSILANMLEYASQERRSLSRARQRGVQIDLVGLKDTENGEQPDDVLDAIEFFFAEFIKLIGDLTSDHFTQTLQTMAEQAFPEGGA